MSMDVQMHNPEAESAVLGSLLLEPQSLSRVVSVLTPDDFFSDSLRTIYEGFLKLSTQPDLPFNVMSLISLLERQGTLERAGGKEQVFRVSAAVPTTLYLDHYVELVSEAAIRRRIQEVARTISELSQQSSLTAEEIVDETGRLTHQLMSRRRGRSITDVGSVARTYADSIDGYVNDGIKTGFKDLDAMTGGFQRSDLIIVAARPGVGKTSLALGAAYNAATRDNRSSMVFSLEMGAEQLVQRLIAMETGVDMLRLRMRDVTEEEATRIGEVADTLASCSLYVDDTPNIGVVELRAKARQAQERYGLDFLVIDYVGLMGSDGKRQDRRVEVDEISRSLKGLARELNVPIIVVAQLNRAVEQRASHAPILSDLRESGQLEQDADMVIFISREEMYDPDNEAAQGTANLHIAKHRNGPLGNIVLAYEKTTTKFENLGDVKGKSYAERQENYDFLG